MKYAFMTFSTPKLSFDEVLATATRYGYDGIEPRLDAEHSHGVEVDATAQQRTAIRDKAEASGIALACLATSLQYADPARTDDMIAQTHDRIDLAGDLGVKSMRIFGGQIPEGSDREQAIDLLVKSLSAVSDHAAERGVTLCFETHDDWTDPKHVAAVVEKVNKPSIAVNWDIMHPVRTKKASIEESFDTLKPWIRHLHVHDGTLGEPLTMVPIGTGGIDHKSAIKLLQTIDYNGYVSGEWIAWEPYDIHLPRELAALKACEK